MSEITATLDDGLEKWIDDMKDKVEGTAISELRSIGVDIVDRLKGDEPSGASWERIPVWFKAEKKTIWTGNRTGTREEHEWPVKTGRSRAAWKTEIRVKGSELIVVVTNPLRYAWMVKAGHDFSNSRSATLLVRSPMKKRAKQFTEDFADLFADSVE